MILTAMHDTEKTLEPVAGRVAGDASEKARRLSRLVPSSVGCRGREEGREGDPKRGRVTEPELDVRRVSEVNEAYR